MPKETTNLGLKLYDTVTDGKSKVKELINNLVGYTDSNMTKIDKHIHSLEAGVFDFDVIGAGIDIDNAGYHNSIYRGKDVTDKLDNGSLIASIKNGTFDDLFIGDYFIKPTVVGSRSANVKYRLAGFNLYRDLSVSPRYNFAVVVPDEGLGSAKMNSTATTVGGYLNSEMHKTTLSTILTNVQNAIGTDNITQFDSSPYVSSSIDATKTPMWGGIDRTGASSTGIVNKTDQDTLHGIGLLSEVNVFGSSFFSSSPLDVSGFGSVYLPLFKFAPGSVRGTNDSEYWLSGVADSKRFCLDFNGTPMIEDANESNNIRPYILIGGKISQ